MASRLREIQESEQKLEMTPMIDVTFLLLIFFMCTIEFKTLEGKLSAYLPKEIGSNPTDAEPVEKVEIKLTVQEEGNRLDPDGTPWDGEGRYEYDDSRVILYQVGPIRTTRLGELKSQLVRLHDADPERGSTIDARPGIVYGDVVPVLDVAIQADFTDITFVGSYE